MVLARRSCVSFGNAVAVSEKVWWVREHFMRREQEESW
jgi:hypothetical protein